jgi:hypothetical protein
MAVYAPVPFEGSGKEARANYNSHEWATEDHETLCARCGASPWLAASKYPCGAEVPMFEVEDWWTPK